MAIYRVQWGGGLYTTNTAGVQYEIWSNTCHIITDGTYDPAAALVSLAGAVSGLHTRGTTHIDATVELDYLKANEIDPETGHQITDPTLVYTYVGGRRGAGTADDFDSLPVTTALRVSLDDGTRNRRARGGFYLPRPAVRVGHAGTVRDDLMDDIQDSLETWATAMNAVAGATLAVYSKRDHAATAVTRMRLGNVPDDISRRKDALQEEYRTSVITP